MTSARAHDGRSFRILFISRAYPPDVGGMQTHNHELACALSDLAEVRVIANGRGKLLLPLFLPWAALRAVTLASRYDVILLGDGVLGFVAWAVKKVRPRTQVVCCVHGLDLTWTPEWYQYWWVRRFLKTADLLVAVSTETEDVAIAQGLSPWKIAVLPNGVRVPPAGPRPGRDELAGALGRPLDGRRVLLSTGRLVKRKGVAWFVAHVLPLLPAEVLYAVAGDGPERDAVRAAVAEARVADRVVLLGRVPDETRDLLFGACDVFVQPNIQVPGDMEGFGIVVLEAASFGMPVVASRLEGLKDAVADGTSGVLVAPGDAAGFARAVQELLDDEPARRALGDSARAYVAEHYAWPHIALRYIETMVERLPAATP